MNEITVIPPQHRVSQIGRYNQYITTCLFCNEKITPTEEFIVGFGTATFKSYSGLAVVVECKACFERQWFHGDDGIYRLWQHWVRDMGGLA